MSFRSLSEIKILRRKYHLTQSELAERAGVSQSLLAKIEAGNVEPTFSKAQKLFTALETLREREETKAEQLMNKKVYTAQQNDSLKKVIELMKRKGISQVPIVSKGKVCGLVTETTILNHMTEHPDKIHLLKAGEVMEDAPPIVSPKTGLRAVTELLRDYQVILVAEKGELKGIISKSDLLGRVE